MWSWWIFDFFLAAIEIKYTSTPVVSKGLHHALADLRPEKAFVIVPETEDYPYSAEVTVTGIASFLNVHLPGLMA